MAATRDSVLAHCIARAVVHEQGGIEAAVEKYGPKAERLSKWSALKVAAKVTPKASRVLNIPPVRHRAQGRALTVSELQELASWFPEHSKRLVLLAGMVGARQRVWFELTDDLVDADAATMTVPASLAKNRRITLST